MTTALEEYPVISLLPKKETGVISFLTKYPEYDGRGTTIVILDSGVDPGAPGLQTTTEGHRKIIHRFDCSGCGDVSTSTVVKSVNGVITGLTGRKLKIPENWHNPTNSYRIGIKHAYSLYPRSLQKEMRAKYLEKNLQNVNWEILAQTRRELSAYDDIKESSMSEETLMKKQNLEATLEILNNFEKKMVDPGPVYDCILFHDTKRWRCCVDTTENGDLENCPLLGEYSLTGDYASLTTICNLNFSFNVHNNGDILELVGLCSSHGTHVASIAAGHFPDKPEENGIAPGAKIISLTIGDGRLGSMESGTALVRAMIKIMELSKTENIDVINMSYGEQSHWSNSGRIGELIIDIVNKYGITWVVSAGNHGPALNTIGTPPDINKEVLIGVGAYVSPEMMVAALAMRQKLPGGLYTFSSRGPTMDGGMGVTICAPGAAITSVPNFTQAYAHLYNGTSMASPHAAGCISLLISGLKKKDVTYSPYSIKRAIEASATYLKDTEVFAQGCGLVNVEKTFDHLTTHYKAKDINVRLDVTCGENKEKGIFVRNKLNVPNFVENVCIEPYFLNSDNVPAEVKQNFNLRLAITHDASYVKAPTYLDLSNCSREFEVKVDTSGLEPGVHNTFITGYDRYNIDKGPMFRLPITVIIPRFVQKPKYSLEFKDVIFEPNTIERIFVHVPKRATWFQLNISNKGEERGSFNIHVLQIIPKKWCKAIDFNKRITINSTQDLAMAFKVLGGYTVEICITKRWSSVGSMKLDYKINFRGILPSLISPTMHAAEGILSMELKTLHNEEIIVPSIVLSHSIMVVRPNDAKISALTSRDVIPPTRQIYDLLLTYTFSLTKTTDVIPNLAPLSDTLYESMFESQLWMLYDSNKQLKGCGDAYPDKYSLKLDKGDYTIRVQVRHEKTEYLEKLRDVPILLQLKLANTIHVDVYSSYNNALIVGKKATSFSSLRSQSVTIYVAPIPSEKLPKNGGTYLTGKISYVKDEIAKEIDTYPFKYIMAEGNNKKNNNGSSEKSKIEDINEHMRDMKIQMLSKLDLTAAEKLYEDLCNDTIANSNLNLYANYLSKVDTWDPKNSLPSFKSKKEDVDMEKICGINSICDKILELIDADSLLINFAVKTDVKADPAKTKKLESQKSTLIDALCHKGIAKCRLLPAENEEDEPKIHTEISDIWNSLSRFVDLNESTIKSTNVLYFLVWYTYVRKCYGKTFKYLIRLQEELRQKIIEEKLIELSSLNEWPH